MRKRIAAVAVFCVYFGACASRQADSKAGGLGPDLDDNAVLALVLTHKFEDGGYAVVRPETGLGVSAPKDAADVPATQSRIRSLMQTKDERVFALIDRLVERNLRPVPLTLASAPERGYVVDYDGKFRRYFEKGGGGWDGWYRDNPQAHGLKTVSLPVYDRRSGLIVVYEAWQFHYRAGFGNVRAYRYDDGVLRVVGEARLSRS